MKMTFAGIREWVERNWLALVLVLSTGGAGCDVESTEHSDAMRGETKVRPAETVAPVETRRIGATEQYVVRTRPFQGAQAYQRPNDGVTYYVEGDGRHVVAISADGVVLWREDPFVQARLEPYRFERPQIVRIGEAASWMIEGRTGDFIGVEYNSTQFGIMDTGSGEFIFMGQD